MELLDNDFVDVLTKRHTKRMHCVFLIKRDHLPFTTTEYQREMNPYMIIKVTHTHTYTPTHTHTGQHPGWQLSPVSATVSALCVSEVRLQEHILVDPSHQAVDV